MRKGEREDKRMISLARVSKWPNTIHAEREKKEYERIRKLEDDEVSKTFHIYPLLDQKKGNRCRRGVLSANFETRSTKQGQQDVPR